MGNKVSKAYEKSKYNNELDISYLELTSIPSRVRSMKHLTLINATANRISNIDRSGIEHLTQVNDVDFAGNKLTLFPAVLIKMTWLTALNLGFNHMEHVPVELKQLRNLKKLDLSGNLIRELPDIFDSFSILEILKIEKNALMDLPPSMDKLTVKQIHIKGNPWTKIPIVMARIKTIEILDMSEGNINELGVDVVKEFAKNETLRVLNLSSNDIKRVPEDVSDLFMLRELDLRKNPIKNWPEKAKNMMNLRFEFEELIKAELWKN